MQVQKIDSIRWRISEPRAVCGFVFAGGADDRGAELVDFGGELAAGVALVAEQRLAAAALAALKQHERDVTLVDLWGGQLQGAWGAVGGDDRVQPKTPEVPGIEVHQP